MTVSKDYYLNLKNGVFHAEGPTGTGPDELAHLFQTIAAEQPERLVLHFHGGLVSEQAALGAIEQTLLPAYRAAGAYPVFFVWHAFWTEVIAHNLPQIYNEKIFQQLLARLLQFVEAKLRQQKGERGGQLEIKDQAEFLDRIQKARPGEDPFNELGQKRLSADDQLLTAEAEQFQEVLEWDDNFLDEAEAIANALLTEAEAEQARQSRSGTIQASRHTLMSPEVLDEIKQQAPSPGERAIFSKTLLIKKSVAILANTIKRLATGRGHGVYTTAVEELLRELYLANAGKLVWDWMKGDTADAFGPDPAQHGGTAFLQRLAALWQSGQQPRIVLVGHSTGAVYICHLLAHADQLLPPEIKFDIVFLAPACDFKLLAQTIHRYKKRINGLRSFGMKDTLEAADPLVPVVPVYPRSLLYFISGVLEDEADKPIVGMERFYLAESPYADGDYPEIKDVADYLKKSGGLIWSVADLGPGRNSAADAHGKFDDADPPTLASVQHIVTTGFKDE
ncbi:MAG: hypothetical protein FOGNACKC_01983 [Anaerolineae bacterium]|nr:hypothetical protein [Anaerolineae bacterium]